MMQKLSQQEKEEINLMIRPVTGSVTASEPHNIVAAQSNTDGTLENGYLRKVPLP